MTPVPGDGPTERERLTGHERWLAHRVEQIKADAYAAGLAARTPAPSAAQAVRDAAAEMGAQILEGDRAEMEPEGADRARLMARRRAVYNDPVAWLDDYADRLDAAPTDPGTRDVEVERPDCTWPRCRRSPNPCFAWCACHLRARLRTPGTEETGR